MAFCEVRLLDLCEFNAPLSARSFEIALTKLSYQDDCGVAFNDATRVGAESHRGRVACASEVLEFLRAYPSFG